MKREASAAVLPFAVPPTPRADLDRLYAAKLGESAISPDMAKAAGLRVLNADEARELVGYCPGVGAILIPYIDGARLRWLGGLKDAPKYGQTFPGCRAYLPPSRDWPAILADASIPIVITEGEFKALCATQHTPLAVIALGGVNSTRSKLDALAGRDLMPELAAAKWKGRVVYIAFDYDGGGTGEPKAEVLRAELALASLLAARGAEVHLVRLGEPGVKAKVGLDDFITARGAGAVAAVHEKLAAALPLDKVTCAEAALAREVALIGAQYVMLDGAALRLGDMKQLSLRDLRALYANRCVKVTVDDKVKMLNPADAWIGWKGRITARGIVFDPQDENIVTATGDINTWRGFATRPEPGDCSPWIEFEELFFAEQPGLLKLWRQWAGHLLRYPWMRQSLLWVFANAAEGVGKSFMAETLAHVIGLHSAGNPHGAAMVGGPDTFSESWTPWAKGCIFIAVNEPVEHGQRISAKLKHYVSSPTVTSNEKYGRAIMVENRINIAATTNSAYSHQMTGDSRREVVHAPEVRKSPEWWAKLARWRDANLGAIHAHYLSVDITGYNPNAPAPATQAKHDMAAAGEHPLDAVVRELCEDREVFTLESVLQRARDAGVHGATVHTMAARLRHLKLARPLIEDERGRCKQIFGKGGAENRAKARVWARLTVREKWLASAKADPDAVIAAATGLAVSDA